MNMPAAMAFPGLMHSPPESDEPRQLSLDEIILSFHGGKPYLAFYRNVPEWEAELIREGRLQGPSERSCWACGKSPDNAAFMSTGTTVCCDNCMEIFFERSPNLCDLYRQGVITNLIRP